MKKCELLTYYKRSQLYQNISIPLASTRPSWPLTWLSSIAISKEYSRDELFCPSPGNSTEEKRNRTRSKIALINCSAFLPTRANHFEANAQLLASASRRSWHLPSEHILLRMLTLSTINRLTRRLSSLTLNLVWRRRKSRETKPKIKNKKTDKEQINLKIKT